MESSSNLILKCLGSALKKTIKYIVLVKAKFFNNSHKKIALTNNNLVEYTPLYICLCQEMIIFLRDDLDIVIEKFSYDSLKKLEYPDKENDIVILHLEKNEEDFKHEDLRSIEISMKNRDVLKDNLTCYYEVYKEFKEEKIMKLPLEKKSEKADKKGKKEQKNHNLGNYEELSINNYKLYVKGKIKGNISTYGYKVKYLDDDAEEKKDKNYQKECNLIFDFGNPIHISHFEDSPNKRDIAYLAETYSLDYLKKTENVESYWVMKNETFIKKINVNEDMSNWEGYQMEFRICKPSYKNIIFIFLRRKYIPPNFDTYQDFTFILKEEASYDNYMMNPEAYNVINIAANSLSAEITSTVKENEIFLKAKVDSLLVDEETLYFYQNTYNIYGEDIYSFGYKLLYALIHYFGTTNVKEKIDIIKPIVDSKKKKFNLQFENWKFEKRDYLFMDKVEEFIEEIYNRTVELKNDVRDNENIDLIGDYDDEDGEDNITPLIADETRRKLLEEKKNKSNSKKLDKFHYVWIKKLMRFIGFVLDGGLIDYKLRYGDFVNDIFDNCQKTNNDFDILCYNSMNIRELQSTSNIKQKFQPKSIIPSLSNESLINYNSYPLNNLISANFLQKKIEGGMKFIASLLRSHYNNDLLTALYSFLRESGKGENADERPDLIELIHPLRIIFEDERECPSTLLLACKNLCLLVNSKSKQKSLNAKQRLIKLSESNILDKIKLYLNLFNHNLQFVLSLLELLSYVLQETKKINIKNILFNNETGLLNSLYKFLGRPEVPGVYYSQRIMIKVLTILLTQTANIEAEVKETLVDDTNRDKIFTIIFDLTDPEKKKEIIDPNEEESSILDFKLFYLFSILIAGKYKLQEYLFDTYDIIGFIEKMSEKLLENIKMIVSLKEKATDIDKRTFGKKVYKFLELVYWLMNKNEDHAKDIFDNCKKFYDLKKYCDEFIYNILRENDTKSEIISSINNIFKKFE